MAVDIRFLGQSCVELRAGGTTVLVDPSSPATRWRRRRRTSSSPT